MITLSNDDEPNTCAEVGVWGLAFTILGMFIYCAIGFIGVTLGH